MRECPRFQFQYLRNDSTDKIHILLAVKRVGSSLSGWSADGKRRREDSLHGIAVRHVCLSGRPSSDVCACVVIHLEAMWPEPICAFKYK